MSFIQGLSAALKTGLQTYQVVSGIKERKQEQERAAAFRDEMRALDEAYSKGEGEFAARSSTPAADAAAAMENASYDRVTERKAGINVAQAQPVAQMPDEPVAPNPGLRQPQHIESAVGQPTVRPGLSIETAPAEQGPSLSMTGVQRMQADASNAPMSVPERDKLYYSKLAQIGGKYLDPDRALAWKNAVGALEKQNFIEKRKDVFARTMAGDRAALEEGAKFYQLLQGGQLLDVSQAQFDPKTRSWTGINAVGEGGTAEPIKLGIEELEAGYLMTEPAQMAAAIMRQQATTKADARAEAADARAERGLRLQEESADDARAHREWERTRAGQRDAAEAENTAWERRYKLASLNLSQQRMALEKAAAERDESARDLLSRQTSFMRMFGVGKEPGENATPEAIESYERASRMAALATMIYGASAEQAKPDERNGIHAEVSQFIRAMESGRVDDKKLTFAENGYFRYGRLFVPQDLFQKPEPAPAPAPAPARAPRTRPGLNVPEENPPGVPYFAP